MEQTRIHILGASGSGTTHLGRALAKELGCAYIDVDGIFWVPTNPPYKKYRPLQERTRMLTEVVQKHPVCVISGSLCGWGDPIIPLLDLVVFLFVPTAERLKRLRCREQLHFGNDALAPGGHLHENYTKFMEWAASYDTGADDMRSLTKHERWLSELTCPVLRLEGILPLETQLAEIRKLIHCSKTKNQ